VSVASKFLALAALPVVGASGYLLLLTLRSRKSAPRTSQRRRTRFHVVVPAHDESAGIAQTVESLLAIEYPPDLFQVIVVADNCSDDTATRARNAGARVLERCDEQRRGKGHALAHAFTISLTDPHVDAVLLLKEAFPQKK